MSLNVEGQFFSQQLSNWVEDNISLFTFERKYFNNNKIEIINFLSSFIYFYISYLFYNNIFFPFLKSYTSFKPNNRALKIYSRKENIVNRFILFNLFIFLIGIFNILGYLNIFRSFIMLSCFTYLIIYFILNIKSLKDGQLELENCNEDRKAITKVLILRFNGLFDSNKSLFILMLLIICFSVEFYNLNEKLLFILFLIKLIICSSFLIIFNTQLKSNKKKRLIYPIITKTLTILFIALITLFLEKYFIKNFNSFWMIFLNPLWNILFSCK